MTKEDYCSYEVAKLLKENGFNWMCNGYYNKDDEDSEPYFGDGDGADNWNNQAPSVRDLWYSAPTHQMAMKWLREKGIDIIIKPLFKFLGGRIYCYEIHSDNTDIRQGRLKTYKEAVEAALKYCLTKVILKDYDYEI